MTSRSTSTGCLWNACSFVNILLDFQSFVYSSDNKLIALSETWLNESVGTGEILPSLFNVFRSDSSSRRGGGVLLAVHDSIPSSLIPSPSDLELVCVKLSLPFLVLVCSVHIVPDASTSYFLQLTQFLASIVESAPHVLLLGDFNLPDICWSTLAGRSSSSEVLYNFVVDHFLEQLVNLPTHSGGNVLDLVRCSSPDCIQNISFISSPLLVSDHFPISFRLLVGSSHCDRRVGCTWFFDYRNTDFDSLNSFLLDIDFSPIYSSTSVDFIWSFLNVKVHYN